LSNSVKNGLKFAKINFLFDFCGKYNGMKNLKHLLIFVAAFGLATDLFSQESEPILDETVFTKPHRSFHLTHQIELNCTNFISKILRDSGENASPGTPYTLGYTVFYKNFGIRTGAGWSSTENLNAGGSNNNAPVIVGFSKKDFRVGLIYQHKISTKWRSTFSIDGQYGWSDNSLTSFFTDAFGNQQNGKIAEFMTRYGGGGSIGIQYFFTDRVGLGTETTCFWQRTESEQKNDFYLPISETPNQTKQDINLSPPTVLYFFFRF
jgi:hypothetical protein